MARPIWKGAIQFGMVAIPVTVHPAVRDHTLHFHQLNRATGHRIALQKVDTETREPVAGEDIEMGFEIATDHYVVITDDERSSIDPHHEHHLEIDTFAPSDRLDPLLIDTSYYLAPDRHPQAYRLLRDTMAEAQPPQVAIGRFVLRNRERPAVVFPRGELLCLSTLHYGDEVVDPATVAQLDHEPLGAKEKVMAMNLVTAMSDPEFDPHSYHDRYTEGLRGLIEAKAAGKQIVAARPEAPAPTTGDLMEALMASVKEAQARRQAQTG